MLKRFLVLFVMLFMVACGTPSYESLVQRYKTNIDNLDTVAAKNPNLKMDIGSKKLEFAAEFEAIAKLSGADQQERMLGLNRRIEDFSAKINPQAAQAPQGNQPAGSKLGAGAQTAAPTNAPPTTPANNTGGSGFGGGGTPAPTTPPPTANSGSGFGGGGTPAPTTPPPATTPAPTQGGSGFGGQ